MVSVKPLVDEMDALARATWWSLVDARRLDTDWGEVTATHTNLLAIARLARDTGITLRIERISQRRERSVGADWEFWVVLDDGRSLGMSIQAKRVYETKKGRLEYTDLGHRGERRNERQYDTLIRHAEKYQTHPIHVFYNGWPHGLDKVFPAGRDDEEYGCASVSTYDVRQIRNSRFGYGANQVANYVDYSFPWSDLFRVPSTAPSAKPSGARPPDDGGPGQGVPPNGHTPINRSGESKDLLPVNFDARGLESLSERLKHPDRHQAVGLRDGLPEYINRALQGKPSVQRSTSLPEFAVVLQVPVIE